MPCVFVSAGNFLAASNSVIAVSGDSIAVRRYDLNSAAGRGLFAIGPLGWPPSDWETLISDLAKVGISKMMAVGCTAPEAVSGATNNPAGMSRWQKVNYERLAGVLATAFAQFSSEVLARDGASGIIGAGLGANYAVKIAVQHGRVSFLILLSPRVVDHGVAINEEIRVLDRPVLFLAESGNQTDSCAVYWLWKNCGSMQKKIEFVDFDGSQDSFSDRLKKISPIVFRWLKALSE